MEKKTYITPAIEVVCDDLMTDVLAVVSGGNANISSSDDDNVETYDQRSRGGSWDYEQW